MEVKIYFEDKEDLKTSIEVLENLYATASCDYTEALINGTFNEHSYGLDVCDILAHLLATLKNKKH